MLGIKVAALHTPREVTERLLGVQRGRLRTLSFRLF